MIPPVDVAPEVFHAASALFGHDLAAGLNRAWTTLTGSLAGDGGMAGSDETATSWAQQYDPAARATAAAIGDLSNACLKIAALLEQTGFNHGMAEASSDPTRSVPTPPDRSNYEIGLTGGAGTSCLTSDPVPTAAGGSSSSAPFGWSLLEHAIGYLWPNGDTGRLRSAANAWATAATALDGLVGYVDEAVEAVSSQQSPEVADAVSVCQSMGTHISDTASACRTLATSCDQLAGHIDQAHQQIEGEVRSFVEWSAGIEVVGGLFSFFTAGAAEGPTQGVEAGRIAATGARIAEIIRGLITAAQTIAGTISTVVARVGDIAAQLRVILGARLSEATANLVARLPSVAEDTGALSFGNLSAWDLGWSQRGLEIEAQLGGNLPRSFPTIDEFRNGVATSIKSVDLTATTYQDTGALTSRLERYVDKVAEFRGKSFDGVTIRARDVTQRVLHIAIQPGVATADQRAVLQQLAQYGENRGVRLIVTEVP